MSGERSSKEREPRFVGEALADSFVEAAKIPQSEGGVLVLYSSPSQSVKLPWSDALRMRSS